MNRLLLAVAVLLLAVAAAAGAGWWQYQRFLDTPLNLPEDGTIFEVPPGASGQAIVDALAAAGHARPGWQWRLLMRLEPRVYRSGEYRLRAGLRPRQVLERLSGGEVVTYRFTIVEGWTFRQMLEALARDPVLLKRLDSGGGGEHAGLLELLSIDHPEGWFLPETYQFTRGDTDADVLLRAHRAMRAALDDAWASRDDGLPLESPYDLLILASIIEKETALDSERAEVAGVFTRRLQLGMRLQTDPTVIYGLGDAFDGDIRRRDLQTDTPYNTYTRDGLPPTPIALPGVASLQAAARPAPGDTLYFVADGNGGHTFSRTLEEHQRAVRKLLNRP